MRCVNISASFDATMVLGDDLVDKFKKDGWSLKEFIDEMLKDEFEWVNTYEVSIDDMEEDNE